MSISKSNQVKNEYRAIGVMSGSSLDGLDICLARFKPDSFSEYEIEQSETIELPQKINDQLARADSLSSFDLLKLDVAYGQWIGETLNFWLDGRPSPDVIGVHGHTVFHEPKEHISLQIGNGLQISEYTGLPVVDQFRTKDLILGGQGAPLVPFGEQVLFPEVTTFINLGGIANISVLLDHKMAYDVAPCNQVLNYLANKLGLAMDKDGLIARKGKMDNEWKSHLISMEYFSQKPPKSLSNQWTQNILSHIPSCTEDALHTYIHFLAETLANTLNETTGSIMITGGGVRNRYLMEILANHLADPDRLIYTDNTLIDYKEALIFAFLGLKRLLNQPNVLADVTGAKRPSVLGVLHLPD
ncbi:MAG: anhydro-N-acetylmuramic acid kinase [Cyclobacteriaceae bacterium]